MILVKVGVPVSADHQQRGWPATAPYGGHQVKGWLVRPMQIFDGQNQRTIACRSQSVEQIKCLTKHSFRRRTKCPIHQ